MNKLRTLLVKIFSPLIICVSILLLIYTFYKSEFYWDGLKRDYYSIYYILSSLLFLFSIISFYLSSKIKEYIVIAGFSLIFSMYIFEGYLTYKNSHYLKIKDKKAIYEKITNKKYDTRTQIEVFEDLKKTEKKVSVKVSPKNWFSNNFSIAPLSSVSNAKTVYGNENGYYFIYLSDRYGFNNPDKEWDSNNIEYFLVGDSFVHGANVNRPDDIASILRNLSNKSVLNLGYSGNGPLIQYAALREYLNEDVKKVLWFYFEDNDFIDLNEEIKSKILNNYLKDLKFSQNLMSKQQQIDDMVNNLVEKGSKGEHLKFVKLYNTRTKLLKKKEVEKIIKITQPPVFKEIMKLAKKLVDKNKSELYFIYLPSYNRYSTNYDNVNYDLVKKTINELKIPFIDIHKNVFLKQENPLKLFPFEMYGHYNEMGYKLIANNVYNLTKGLNE